METNLKTRKAVFLAEKLQISIKAQICLINQLINEINESNSISEINEKSRILKANLFYRNTVLYYNICDKYDLKNYFLNGVTNKPIKTITAGYDFLGI